MKRIYNGHNEDNHHGDLHCGNQDSFVRALHAFYQHTGYNNRLCLVLRQGYVHNAREFHLHSLLFCGFFDSYPCGELRGQQYNWDKHCRHCQKQFLWRPEYLSREFHNYSLSVSWNYDCKRVPCILRLSFRNSLGLIPFCFLKICAK